jgi:hypothetical protein
MTTRTVDKISEALRSALVAYNALEQNNPVRALVAQRLFGVTAAVVFLPRLDELAKNVRSGPE